MKRAVGLVDTSLILAWCTVINLCFVHGNIVSGTQLYTNNSQEHLSVSNSTNDENISTDGILLKRQIITALPLFSIVGEPVRNITYVTYNFAGNGRELNNKKLLFLPGLALVCFIVLCLMRVLKWYSEKGKFADRGCSYDVASYVILSQGHKDYCDVDTESPNDSFTSRVPMRGVHGSINASKSLQYRIDAQIYDTVSSYRSYLTRTKKEHVDNKVNGEPESERNNNQQSGAVSKKTRLQWGAGQSSNKLSKDSSSSVIPVIDNYVRLKNHNASYLKSSMVKIGLPTKINRFTVQKYGPRTDGENIAVEEIPEKRLKVSYNPVVQKISHVPNISASKRIRTVSLNVNPMDDQLERKPRSISLNQCIKQPIAIKSSSMDVCVQTDQCVSKKIFESSADDSDKSTKDEPTSPEIDNFAISSENKREHYFLSSSSSSNSLSALDGTFSWKRRRRKQVSEREIATQTEKSKKENRRRNTRNNILTTRDDCVKSSPKIQKSLSTDTSGSVDIGNNADNESRQEKPTTPNSICIAAEIHNNYDFQLNNDDTNSSTKETKDPSNEILSLTNQNKVICNGVFYTSKPEVDREQPSHIGSRPQHASVSYSTSASSKKHDIVSDKDYSNFHSTSSISLNSSRHSLSTEKGKRVLHRSFPVLPDQHGITSGLEAFDLMVQCTCVAETGFNTCSYHDDSGCAMYREESSKYDNNDNLKHSSCESFRSSSISSYLSSLSSNEKSLSSDAQYSVAANVGCAETLS